MSRLLIIILFFSCSKNSFQKIEESYEGPVIEIKDMNTFFSDSAQVKFKLKAKLYQVYSSGEEKYPEGLDMDIYSKNSESISATFKANHVIKYENENYFEATGNVILFNLETNDELSDS